MLLRAGVLAEIFRAHRERVPDAAATRKEAELRRAGEERLRIAQELHDVVAHHISLINVQASTALHLVDRRPEQAGTALAAIKDASKEALVELRSIVGMLRQTDQAAPRQPVAGLDRLDDLVSRTSQAGLAVHAVVHGEPRPLPTSVDRAAYRIIQESLTNVVRHAKATAATVRMPYGEEPLVRAGRRRRPRPLPARSPRATASSGCGNAPPPSAAPSPPPAAPPAASGSSPRCRSSSGSVTWSGVEVGRR